MRSSVAILVTLIIAAIVGVGAYQLGVAQGLATTGGGTAVAPAYYYHPFFGGFGFLGLLFPLLFIFLIFGLLRSAFWGGWGRHYGTWSSSYADDRRKRFEELHDELHRGTSRDTGSSSQTPPTGR